MILHLCKGQSETNKTNGSGGPSLTFSHFGIECKIKAFWIWCHAKRQSHQALVVLLNNLTCTWKLNNIGHSCSLSLCLSSLDSFHWWFIASHFSCSKYLHFPFIQSNMLTIVSPKFPSESSSVVVQLIFGDTVRISSTWRPHGDWTGFW